MNVDNTLLMWRQSASWRRSAGVKAVFSSGRQAANAAVTYCQKDFRLLSHGIVCERSMAVMFGRPNLLPAVVAEVPLTFG